LRIATWNVENLHAVDGQSTFTGGDPSVQRFAIDYERMKCYVRLFDPDILAVQEVDGEAALKRVVDTDVYEVVVSKRSKPNFMNGQQNTGFAYKKGLSVQPREDFTDIDVSNGSLRRDTRIDLTHQGKTFHLMSVHLKSGGFDNGSSGSACQKLFTQVPKLEQWIDDAAAGPNPFIVLGDFNRRFNRPEDLVWTNLDDAEPPNADLTAITEHMPISCRDNKFTDFIDHLVFDKRAIAFVDRSSFRHVTYRQADREVWNKISDHCPVVVEMWVQ
jgi:endonuclease/exonuclease/phosphatase family metal-dependent hydrolase